MHLERPLGSATSPSLIKEGDRGSSFFVIPAKAGIHNGRDASRPYIFKAEGDITLLGGEVQMGGV